MDEGRQVGAARAAVLALRREDLATLVVGGADRVAWLNGLLTCDLARRKAGEAVYGLAVARNGRVLADALVVDDEPDQRIVLVVARAAVDSLREHFEHYLVMEDAEIAAGSDAFEVWALHGPRSTEVLDAARGAGALVAAVDRTGDGGGLVLAPSGDVGRRNAARAAVEGAVARAGGVVGDRAGWEALRLERAVPEFGADFDEKTYPQEAALEKTAVRFDKGCYLGQEVVCMLEMRGHVKRKLVSLVFEAPDPPRPGAAVHDEAGATVGEVTSADRSPTLGTAVALAMVKRAFAETGKRLTVDGVGAKVVERPA